MKSQTLKVEDYVASVAEATGNTKKAAREIIKEFLSQWAGNTANGVPSHFVGVGKTEIRSVEGSEKRNPRTGEKVFVEAHQKPRFQFAGKIKDSLRGL